MNWCDHTVVLNLVNFGSGSDILPGNTKELPEPVLTNYHQGLWHSLMVISQKILTLVFLAKVCKLQIYDYSSIYQGGKDDWNQELPHWQSRHYSDVIMSTMASQITSLTVVYSTMYLRRRSNKTSKFRVTSLCEGNSQVTGEFPAHKGPVARKMFPFDDASWYPVVAQDLASHLEWHQLINRYHKT